MASQLSKIHDESAGIELVIISIVAMNCEGYVVDCLSALLRGTDRNLRIFVIENGDDAAFEKLRRAVSALAVFDASPADRVELGAKILEFPLAKRAGTLFLCKPAANLGYAGANNIAIRQSIVTDWDAIWILNPDTIPEAGALEALIEHRRAGGYDMVGSRLVFEGLNTVQTWGGLRWNLMLGRGYYLGYMMPADKNPDCGAIERKITFISGASMFVTRDYIRSVGPMDESFFMYGEDLEWCLRGAGQRFGYAHESIVRHVHGGVSGASRIKRRRSPFSIYFGERNKVLIARRYLGWRAPIAIAIYLALLIEYLVRGRSWRQFVTALRGWQAGVRGLTGPAGF